MDTKEIQEKIIEEGLGEPWIGIDLDGTLAIIDHNTSGVVIGEPVEVMRIILESHITEGYKIKIFTARASYPEQIPIVKKWLKDNNFPELEITCQKDFAMIRFYDDSAVTIERNTGRILGMNV